MMTSDRVPAPPRLAYVWIWLPGATEPVVCGRLDMMPGGYVTFTYGRGYLERSGAISLYEPELPLRRGPIDPPRGLRIASSIRDAGPDAWGQRVIFARWFGHLDRSSDTGDLDQLSYLLDSGSDRIGGLDFQTSATDYQPRRETAPLEKLQRAAELLESGMPLGEPLSTALLRGTSIGGARPKVLIEDEGRQLIAKLSSATDPYPVVKAEALGLELARRVGLTVPPSQVVSSLGRDVLLVERFDRTATTGERLLMVSALTILGLDEMMARYATYPDLADAVRARFTRPRETLRELFTRIVVNVCIGNTDDHARNHAAFWDGQALTLTPGYDLCPQLRSGQEAAQAMAIDRTGSRASHLRVCLDAAPIYLLSTQEAREVIDAAVTTIGDQWQEAADAAQLTKLERSLLWRNQILSPFIFHDWN